MKILVYFLMIFPALLFAQIDEEEADSTDVVYIIVEGDSIPTSAINLNEILLLHRLKFSSDADRKRYLVVRRKTIKVYPYAKLAAERLESLNERLNSLQSESEKRRYSKLIQKYIEEEFSEELKKLSKTEGQILVKLIHRQTGTTTFDLIKNLRSGWRAFWFNNTALLFNISLKEKFDPWNVKEDYLIEDILERNFQSGRLERQKSALDYDIYELTNKWLHAKEMP
ncbi:DUF4294 domain-containing protein [Bizionia myxarmorum]|uniref:DUF4294 domain-containing protein n=1 Tax=Bizionia myxarmorum TaxID=291186 RepID=A0A5D0RGI0_9FLAO|nr:DUF4294 domain-containing protein [Bizionia myxarmorum]TYB79818.1 DUF4294 domain-containing protein [Bizionia myxarmorum]